MKQLHLNILLIKKTNNEKGFSLIELLAVIVILGIMASISVPSIGGVIEGSRIKAAKADMVSVLNVAKLYFIQNSDDVADINDLKPYMESWGVLSDIVSTSTDPKAIRVIKGGEHPIQTDTIIVINRPFLVGSNSYTISYTDEVSLKKLDLSSSKVEGIFTLVSK